MSSPSVVEITFATAGMAEVQSAIEQITSALSGLESAVTAASSEVQSATEGIGSGFQNAASQVGSGTSQMDSELQQAGQQFQQVGQESEQAAQMLQTSGEAMTTVGSEATSSAGEVQQLGESFTAVVGPAEESVSILNGAGTEMQTVGQAAQTTAADLTGLDEAFSAEAGPAEEMISIFSQAGTTMGELTAQVDQEVGAMGPLGGAITQTTEAMNNENGAMTQTATSATKSATEHKGLGMQIGLVGTFAAGTVSQVMGLVSGYTGLEQAATKVAQTHVRVESAQIAVQHATEKLEADTAKYGASSQQVADDVAKLQKAHDALGVAESRNEIATSKLNEKWVEYGVQIVEVGGSMAMMGTSIADLIGKLGLHAAATAADAGATGTAAAASTGAAVAIGAEGAAAEGAAATTGELDTAMLGLDGDMLPIIITAAAIAAAFVLIETNTFGMGDAFRQVVTVIATGIDAMLSGLKMFGNAIVESFNALAGFGAQVNNIFVNIYNAIITFVNNAVSVWINFAQQLENALKEVYNFIVSAVINPIISAWNTFIQGLEVAWANMSAKLASIFAPVASAIVGGIKQIAESANTVLNALNQHWLDPAVKSLEGFSGQLDIAAKNATATGQSIQTGFTGAIPPIQQATVTTSNFNQQLIPLSKGFMSVTDAVHTYDAALQSTDSTVARNAAQTVIYYSHWENLSKLLNSTVAPAFKASIAFIETQANSMLNAISAGMGFGKSQEGAAASTSKLGEAEKTVKGSIEEVTNTLNNNVATQNLSNASTMQLIAENRFAVQGLSDVAKGYVDAAVKNQEMNAVLNSSVGFMNLFQTGAMNASVALKKLQEDNITAAGGIAKVAEQLNAGTIQLANYQAGQLKVLTDLEKMATDAANAAGGVEELRQMHANGAEQAAIYSKAIADTGTAYFTALDKVIALDAELGNGTAIINRYNTAIQEGKAQLGDFIVKTEDSIVSQAAFDAGLSKVANSLGFLNTGLVANEENWKNFIAASMGSVDALNKIRDSITKTMDSFFQLGDEVGNKLGQAMEKGSKDFDKAMKDIEKSTGIKFDPEQKFALSVDAAMHGATDRAKTDIGVLVAMVAGGLKAPEVANAAQDMMMQINGEFSKAGPVLLGNIQHTMALFVQAVKTQTPQAVGAFMDSMNQMGQSAAEKSAILDAMTPVMRNVAAGMLKMGSEASVAAAQFTAMGDKVNYSTGAVTNSAGQTVGVINKLTGQFMALPGAVTPATTSTNQFATALSQLGGLSTVAQAVFENIGRQATAMAAAVAMAFRTLNGQVAPYLGTLASLVQSTFNSMTVIIQNFVTTALVNSLTKGFQNAGAAVLTILGAMSTAIVSVLNILTAAIQNFVTTALVNSLTKGIQNAAVAVLTAWSAMSTTMVTVMNILTAAIQNFVTTALTNSLVKGTQNAAAAVLTAWSAMSTTIVNVMNILTSAIQNFITTAMQNSLVKGTQNAAVAVLTAWQAMSTTIVNVLNILTGAIQNFVRTALVQSLQAGVLQTEAIVNAAFTTMQGRVQAVMNAILSSIRSTVAQCISIIASLTAAINSVPTVHHTNFTASDNVGSVAARVTSEINAVPTTHNTTFTRTVITRNVTVGGGGLLPPPPMTAGGGGGGMGEIVGGAGYGGGMGYVTTTGGGLEGGNIIINIDGREVAKTTRKYLLLGTGGLT